MTHRLKMGRMLASDLRGIVDNRRFAQPLRAAAANKMRNDSTEQNSTMRHGVEKQTAWKSRARICLCALGLLEKESEMKTMEGVENGRCATSRKGENECIS